MNLFQIRKGQLVYHNNELHRIYAVKQMYKQSVHAIRLRDLEQVLTTAPSVEKYKPKEGDSFIFHRKPYTLVKRQAVEGDSILIHNPKPDPLDTYSLHEIDVVEEADEKGISTSRSFGLRHNEYLVMAPGRAEGSRPIDRKQPDGTEDTDVAEDEHHFEHPEGDVFPKVGSIYRKKDTKEFIETMVIAIEGQRVYLGGGYKVTQKEIMDKDRWEYVPNSFPQ
ncbi:hypothetical protein [Aureibacillus halotolerans]|uniref:Uncharacterized protein n=1 Tax=Aureibacillus halotolerans TaxID=1508390 RepID=A0A4R6TPK2_9BACI|nr:hypothetical protein [Aureibacillus halotolerans]TDQ33788.1 hypothetical protein EV213_12820 [Aureibacillus halotolerans]